MTRQREERGAPAGHDYRQMLLMVAPRVERAIEIGAQLEAAAPQEWAVEWAASLPLALQAARRVRPARVLVELPLDTAKTREDLKQFLSACDRPVTLIVEPRDQAAAQEAMEAGAAGWLFRESLNASTLLPLFRAPVRQPTRAAPSPRGNAKLIAFLGAKGGAGTTTAALNIAAALAVRGHKVIAAELPIPPGGFADHFHAGDDHAAWNELNTQGVPLALPHLLMPVTPGLRLLFAPSEDVRPTLEVMLALVRGAAREAEYVLLDLGATPHGLAAALAAECEQAVLVVDRDHASTRLARRQERFLRRARCLGMLLPVTRSSDGFGKPVDALAQELRLPLLAAPPPAAGICFHALERQQPVVLSFPDSLLGEVFFEAADRLRGAKPMAPVIAA